eukprot:Skav221131  [mRNA]  locus=scaffold233:618680:620187:- [translate_table: standard]
MNVSVFFSALPAQNVGRQFKHSRAAARSPSGFWIRSFEEMLRCGALCGFTPIQFGSRLCRGSEGADHLSDYKYEEAEKQDQGDSLRPELAKGSKASAKDESQALSRDVVVNDARDLNECLGPTEGTDKVLLMAITLDNGTRIDRPTAEESRSVAGDSCEHSGSA